MTTYPLNADIGYDVIVIAGQSNSSGGGTFANGTLKDLSIIPTNPRVWQLGRGTTYNNQIILADNPLHNVDGYDIASGALPVGFQIPFAAEYIKTQPLNRSVLIVPCGMGGTSIAQWSPTASSPLLTLVSTSSGMNLFNDMVRRANVAMAGNPNNRLVAVLWSQGEADCSSTQGGANTPSATYLAALQGVIDNFRSAVIGAGRVPWVLAPLATDFWGLTYSGGVASATTGSQNASIQNAIDSIPGSRANTAIIPQSNRSDLTGNNPAWPNNQGNIHFSGVTCAYALGPKLFTAFQGVNPAAVAVQAAPVASAASSVSGSGFTANWSAASGAVKYAVWYRVTGTTPWSVAFAGNVTSLALTGLAASASYDFEVVAVNSTGIASVPSNLVTQSTAAGAPATPSAPALSAITTGGFTANWSAVTGATSYTLNWRSPSGSGSYTTVSPNASTNSQTVTGLTLTNGQTLGVTVTASNASGSSSASTEGTGTVGSSSVFPLTFAGSNGAAPSGNSAISTLTSVTNSGITVDGSGSLVLPTNFVGGYFASTGNVGDGAVDFVFASGTSTRNIGFLLRATSGFTDGYFVKHDGAGHHYLARANASGTSVLTLPAFTGSETSIGLKIVGSLVTYRINGADTANTWTDPSPLATSASRFIGVFSTDGSGNLKIAQINFS